jgi:hypothetical protein
LVGTNGNTCGVTITQGKMYLNVIVVGKELKNKESKDLGCACYGNNQVHRCFCNDTKPLKLQKVEVTMQEIWQQTIPKIHTSKKTYRRKNKHKNQLD